MRRAAKIDANMPEIVKALRAAGAFVVDLSRVGAGFPDLLVGFRHTWHLIEVKNGALSPSRQALTTDETAFHRMARGFGPLHVVRDATEALQAIGAIK